jgi:ABC-2 type transport system permease protein
MRKLENMNQGAAQLLQGFRAAETLSFMHFLAVIVQAQSSSQELHNASIGLLDEDHSELSHRITHAFLPLISSLPSRSRSEISFR